MKKLVCLLLLVLFIFVVSPTFAQGNSFISVEQKIPSEFQKGGFSWQPVSVVSKIVKFLSFLLIVCLVPGLVMTNKLFDKDSSHLKQVFLALIIGFVLITIIFYVLSLLNLRFLVFIYILVNLFLLIKLKLLQRLKFNYPKWDKLTVIMLAVIFAGTIFQNIPTFRSGLTYEYGLGFWGPNTHDGVWHISLINQLIRGLPVENPIFAGTILKNYHFFYDLMVAVTVYFTKISILDLVFRFYPIIFSLLLGIGTYLFAASLSQSRTAAIFSLYFVYFAGSFGWIVDWIKNKSFGGESAFWANQSISFNLNPPYASSLLIIIAFLLLLKSIKQINSKIGIFIAVVLLSSLSGFKSYGAVLTITSLGVIALINLFRKQLIFLYICIFSIASSLVIFLSNFEIGQKLVIFSPFWLVHSMIDSSDRVGWIRLSLARTVGLETKNWIKFISAETAGLLIFILGNLGIRFLSLYSLLKIKQIVTDTYCLFLFIFCLLSFLIPIIFIQSGNPWNIIQFSYYGLYIAAVSGGIVLFYLARRLPWLSSLAAVAAIAILAPVNSITTASYYTGELPHALVAKKEVEALEFLSRLEDGTVLIYPYDKKLQSKIVEPWPLFAYTSSAYVSALSSKAVYLEDEPQNQILLTDYKKRLVASKDFFLRSDNQVRKFLNNNNIKYIYVPKIFQIGLDEVSLNIKNIFDNDKVVIYRII